MKKASLKLAKQRTAKERIEELFEQASKRKAYAKRYVELARKISQRLKVRIPLKFRRQFCKNCNAFLKIGENCRKRTYNGRIIMTCLECNEVKRLPLVKK